MNPIARNIRAAIVGFVVGSVVNLDWVTIGMSVFPLPEGTYVTTMESIVSFHIVWSGIPLVLTVLGWANVVKSLVYLTFPAFGLRKLQFLSHERANLVVGGGILFLLLACDLGYHL